jgi:hypothetical protein
LAAITIFVNAVKGISALQLGRDLDVQYKTALVMAYKLREAISAKQMQGTLSGEVEVDGAYFGGHSHQSNEKMDRIDRRSDDEANLRRQSLVVARQRGGRILPIVVPHETDAVAFIRQRVGPGHHCSC